MDLPRTFDLKGAGKAEKDLGAPQRAQKLIIGLEKKLGTPKTWVKWQEKRP